MRKQPRILLLTMFFAGLAVCGFAGEVAGQVQEHAGRQVTVMVIRARKGVATTDPKLAAVESRLAQLLPNHGFSLLAGKTREMNEGDAIDLPFESTKKLSLKSIDSEDPDGKVKMKVRLETGQGILIDSTIRTPPNQLFFLDHRIDDNEHLLIAVGAR